LSLVCALLAAAAVLVWLFMCDRPADLGLKPFGPAEAADASPPPAGAGLKQTSIAAAALHSLRDAARTRTFWILFGTFFICGASTNGLATVPPTLNITVKTYGRDKANLVFGWIFAGHQLGAATAALGAGVARTELATYLPAFLAAGALCIVAAGMTLWLAPRRAPLRVNV
jgi:hypothetical protein